MNGQRLASVLRIRNLQERAARGALASSRYEHRRAEAAERLTWQSLDERVDRGHPTAKATTIRGGQMLVAAGMLAAETQNAATLHAADAVVAATESWTIAARRVEGLERLVQRQADAAREEAARRSSNEIDDLVLIRFAGQRS